MNIIKQAYAQSVSHRFKGFGDVGLENTIGAGSVLTQIISNLVGIMTIFGLLWFLIQIIVAGYNFISAGGDTQKIKDAQQQLQNNFIGAAILVAAVFLLSLVGQMLGIDNILDLEALINIIAP